MKMKKCLRLCSLILAGVLFLSGCGKSPIVQDNENQTEPVVEENKDVADEDKTTETKPVEAKPYEFKEIDISSVDAGDGLAIVLDGKVISEDEPVVFPMEKLRAEGVRDTHFYVATDIKLPLQIAAPDATSIMIYDYGNCSVFDDCKDAISEGYTNRDNGFAYDCNSIDDYIAIVVDNSKLENGKFGISLLSYLYTSLRTVTDEEVEKFVGENVVRKDIDDYLKFNSTFRLMAKLEDGSLVYREVYIKTVYVDKDLNIVDSKYEAEDIAFAATLTKYSCKLAARTPDTPADVICYGDDVVFSIRTKHDNVEVEGDWEAREDREFVIEVPNKEFVFDGDDLEYTFDLYPINELVGLHVGETFTFEDEYGDGCTYTEYTVKEIR